MLLAEFHRSGSSAAVLARNAAIFCQAFVGWHPAGRKGLAGALGRRRDESPTLMIARDALSPLSLLSAPPLDLSRLGCGVWLGGPLGTAALPGV